MNSLKIADAALRNLAIKTIRAYQKTLSFDHGKLKFLYPYGYCKFNPTCSEYAIRAITAFGPIKGGVLAVWRVIRCHPYARGGNDPVRYKKSPL